MEKAYEHVKKCIVSVAHVGELVARQLTVS